MKTTLTIEQSAELIKRGVKADKASMVCIDFNGTYAYVCGEEAHTVRDCVNGQFYVEESRVFTLADLFSLLPKKITFGHRTNCRLKIQPIISSKDCISEVWQACYLHTSLKANAEAPELIDALYNLLLWAIDNNHVKLD